MHTMLFLSLFSFFSRSQESGIEQIKDFGSNPGNLEMFQYVPENFKKNAPLVIVLHGCTQSADTIALESGWNKLADANKFMVVYPQQKLVNNIKKCFNWFNPSDIKRESGETASIKQMIDFAIDKHKIDRKRVFITGLSAGGAMAMAMLANYPETFSAGAIMSGIPFGPNSSITAGINAMKGNVTYSGKEWADFILDINKDYKGSYPKIVLFQGEDDPYVNFENADEIIKQYTYLHQIENSPIIFENFDKNKDVSLYKYGNSKGLVLYYKIKNMGHALAIDPGINEKQGGAIATYAVDKNFHSTYWAANFFNIAN